MLEQLNDLNYRYIWLTRRYLVYAVGLFALSGLIAFFALYNQIQTDLSLYSNMTAGQARVEKLRLKNLQLSQLGTSELMVSAQQVNASLPSQKPLTPLLLGLNAVANTAGVNIDEISLSPGEVATDSAFIPRTGPNRNQKYDAIDLELTVSGTLDEINTFLRDIERFAPFSSVSSLSLSKRVRDTEGMFDAELIVTTYYFAQSVTVSVDSLASVTLTTSQQEALQKIRGFLFPEYVQPTTIEGGGLEDLFGIDQLEGVN